MTKIVVLPYTPSSRLYGDIFEGPICQAVQPLLKECCYVVTGRHYVCVCYKEIGYCEKYRIPDDKGSYSFFKANGAGFEFEIPLDARCLKDCHVTGVSDDHTEQATDRQRKDAPAD
jgi:hypothetical protein